MTVKRSLHTFLIIWLLISLTGAILPQMVSAETTRTVDSDITISCDVPGQIVEAGETATFDLTVTNNGQEINRAMWYETYEVSKYDWDIRFMDGTREVNLLALSTGEKKDITVLVETNSETPADRYAIRLQIGDGYYWLYVTISKTHTGEKGVLELAVVDKDGEKIKSAVVTVKDGNSIVDTVMSTADGSVSAQIDQGTYTVTIGKSGYSTVEKKDVKIKGGITTDIGTVMLDKALYAADVTVKSPVITTTASANPSYDLIVSNSGKSDDTYQLSVEGAPEEWYFRFRESTAQSVDLSELFLKSGDEKSLTLEAIPP
ncbi:MAG: carboxypeptidase regulatory-like domain-containing protein, partial [Methanomicrobiales archaeon]|nr:carboxypeptidase regulatory-like domain-containing protein [Methanomicrobiales archaeon]